MVQPDGTARIFNLTDAEKGILAGPKPWLGVIKDRRIDIWADPEYTGGKLRTAFTFVAGRLRLMILDGKRYTFAKASPQDDTLERLFPKRKVRNYERNSTADIQMLFEISNKFHSFFLNVSYRKTGSVLVSIYAK